MTAVFPRLSAYMLLVTTLFATIPALAGAPPSSAIPATSDAGAAALAKQLSNPVAALTSVPFQLNWDGGVGATDDTRFLLNFQPVMPFSLNEKWNFIARVIVPVLSQPISSGAVGGGTATFGVSDILFSAFLSPAHPKGAIWGVGPVLSLPTTADPYLGTEKWSAGPTVLVLKQSGKNTYGILANQLWSFAGDDTRGDVNQTYVQPFFSIGTKKAVTFTFSSESSANWNAASGDEWTVPILFNISKIVKLGKKPMSVGFGVGDYLDQPTGGPEWKFRSAITLLFPK